ncbi:MAG: hypothetical protein ACPGRW_06380 [Flavobacteriaceae bacterium]
MALTQQQAREVLESPKNRTKIESVKRLESQLRVFTEAYSKEELSTEEYYNNVLLKGIEEKTESKYGRILKYFRYPLPTSQVADAILNDFFKVFYGKNRFFDVQADRDITRLKDWIVSENLEKWIEINIKDVFKNKPNSYVVVDVENSKPYLLNIDSSRLVDVSYNNKGGDLNYIAFLHSQTIDDSGDKTTYYSVYCKEYYRVFSKHENQSSYILHAETPHNLDRCPARPFIGTAASDKNLLKRKVAFTESLSRLEDYTIFDVFRNYLDHYAPFPVTEAPEAPCQNNECVGGKVAVEQVVSPLTDEREIHWHDCKVCNGGKNKGAFVGPGLHIGIQVSEDKSTNDASGVFKMHFPDTESLKFIPEKLDTLAMEVKNGTIGVNGSVTNEAVNELQAKGGFESMESVLIRTKTELDNLYTWVVDVVGSLFYKNVDLSIEANYGTEFYLLTEAELQERFKQSKEIGLPIAEQIELYIQLVETKYRGNTAKIQRQKMLLMLDPLPLTTSKEALELSAMGVISDDVLTMKINFLNLISKFEVENGSISNFGIALELPKRVEAIKNTLLKYNQINKVTKQKNETNQGE